VLTLARLSCNVFCMAEGYRPLRGLNEHFFFLDPGRKPQEHVGKINQARGAGDSRRHGDRSIGSRCVLDPLATARGSVPLPPAPRARLLFVIDPGAYAPGFMLSPAPQAQKSLTSISA
jgi:hypothetical protein